MVILMIQLVITMWFRVLKYGKDVSEDRLYSIHLCLFPVFCVFLGLAFFLLFAVSCNDFVSSSLCFVGRSVYCFNDFMQFAIILHSSSSCTDILKKQCGLGTFGKVVMALDTKHDKDVAIKIVRSIDKYVKSAKIEAEILNDVYDKQKKEKFTPCVKMYQSFCLEKHFCLVFEPLGMSLYDFIKKNNYRGFSHTHTKNMSRQLIEAMDFLHAHGIIHTDLKLENILLVDDSYDLYNSITGKRIDTSMSSSSLASSKKMKSADDNDEATKGNRASKHGDRVRSSSSKKENREAIAVSDVENSRRIMNSDACMVPRNTKIKIIDFGGATYDNDPDKSTIVNTRQYRGPEVTLELGWSYASDMWSCGCIIAEIASGELLFPTHDNLEHLAMMEKR